MLRWLKIPSIIHREEKKCFPQTEKITGLNSQGLMAVDEQIWVMGGNGDYLNNKKERKKERKKESKQAWVILVLRSQTYVSELNFTYI